MFSKFADMGIVKEVEWATWTGTDSRLFHSSHNYETICGF